MQPVNPSHNAQQIVSLSDVLTNLVGNQLSSVEFVQDYIQLHFDGATLSAYTLPTVAIGGAIFVSDDPGYRDALCAAIGSNVRRAHVEPDRLFIEFENGSAVAVSLREDDYRGPEAIQLSLDGDRFWVV